MTPGLFWPPDMNAKELAAYFDTKVGENHQNTSFFATFAILWLLLSASGGPKSNIDFLLCKDHAAYFVTKAAENHPSNFKYLWRL